MPQYLPNSLAASGGGVNQPYSNVIDPEMIEHELRMVAEAHNSHATQDFGAACVTTTHLQKAYSKITIPFGLLGSWTLSGNITLASNQVSLLIPYAININGGYVHAQNAYDAAGGSIIKVNLYKNTTAVWAAATEINNFTIEDEGSITYTKTDPGVALAAGDYLHFRASAQASAVLKNIIFYLNCSVLHST